VTIHVALRDASMNPARYLALAFVQATVARIGIQYYGKWALPADNVAADRLSKIVSCTDGAEIDLGSLTLTVEAGTIRVSASSPGKISKVLKVYDRVSTDEVRAACRELLAAGRTAAPANIE
jgi:hypothetical protein